MKPDAGIGLFPRPLQPDRAAEGGADIGLHPDGGESGWGWTASGLRNSARHQGFLLIRIRGSAPPPQPAPARGAGVYGRSPLATFAGEMRECGSATNTGED